MAQNDFPLVSIGMPVYNGENYLEEAIQSVLKQDYPNIEFIISDNASEDGTRAICEKYMHKDKRIVYHRFEENQGASRNFARTFELSKGKYFKWAAHDDKLSPNYLTTCVEQMEKDPEIGLCQTFAAYIDGKGKQIGQLKFEQINFPHRNPFLDYLVFLRRFRYRHDDVIIVNGVFRSETLAKTKMIDSYNTSDLTLLANLVLISKINIVPEYLFHYRWHDNKSTSKNRKNSTFTQWFDPKRKSKNIPLMIWFKEFNFFISQSKLRIDQKVIARFATLQWLNFRIYKGIKRRLIELI